MNNDDLLFYRMLTAEYAALVHPVVLWDDRSVCLRLALFRALWVLELRLMAFDFEI